MNIAAPNEDNPAAPSWLKRPKDVNALVPEIWPVGARRDQTGVLQIGGCAVTELVEQFGSPLYVLDQDDFVGRATSFRAAFADWEVFYASKTLLTRRVAKWIEQVGLGLDVCSANELALAQAVSFPAQRIELHGNNKSLAELTAAVDQGIARVVVDCFEEIDRLESIAAGLDRMVVVSVRVSPGISAHTHEYISTSHQDQKFGFSLQSGQALAALEYVLEQPHLHLTGLHCHIGSQIMDTAGYIAAANRLCELAASLRDLTGHEISQLDLGGGFGIAYTLQDQPLTAGQWAAGLNDAVREAVNRFALPAMRLAIEPGRAIAGPAGVALYTVGVVKPIALEAGERCYVSVDGGMSDNIRPALYGADYTAVLANRISDARPLLSRVVGKHCESGDVLVHDVWLPADVMPGDLLAVPGAGAYTRPLSSNYNMAARPAWVSVQAAAASLMLRRETLDDLLACDLG
ncbi:MAG: diaminopimelate decarboxylase [Propionibacteriaceae bacterium]|nr:diaminopimelate decarboxylase [Propionibacteriaceae bacterium]